MTGAGRYLAGVAPAIAECGPQDEFVLLARKGCAGLWKGLPRNMRLKEVDIPAAGLKQHFAIRKILKEIAPDVFHYPMFDLPHGLNVPSVITVHDLNAMLFPRYFAAGGWWRRPAAIFLYASAIYRASHVLTALERTRNELTGFFPLTKGKVTAIHYGYHANAEVGKTADIEELKKRFGFMDQYFLYVGVHRSHKNLEGLINAMAFLKEKRVKVSLVVAGELDIRFPEPMRQSERLGLNDVIKFVGYVSEEELNALYRNAAVFVFPSFQEGFGFPLLEAMDFGVPIACSDIPVHREVAGDAAEYFDPYSPQNIATALQKLLTDVDLRRLLAERGKERIRLFQWRDCAAATLEVYRKVAGRSKGKSGG